MSITYIEGDATKPIGTGKKIIAHICNDQGKWGKGFVLAISRRWSLPKQEFYRFYKTWCNRHNTNRLSLGLIQLIKVEQDLYIANLIGQYGIYKNRQGLPPIRYNAVNKCLQLLAKTAKEIDASIHMPRIGCGLAGGNWNIIESIIKENLNEFPVIVYDWN